MRVAHAGIWGRRAGDTGITAMDEQAEAVEGAVPEWPKPDPTPDPTPEVVIPALAMVVIASRPAEAAQTFAARHFSPEEVVSVESAGVASEAFEVARFSIAQRLSDGLLTVAVIGGDSADLSAALARLAHHHDVAPVALTLGREIAAARFPLGPRSYAAAHALAPHEWLT